MITQDAVQLTPVFRVVPGREIPTCLTVRLVISLPGDLFCGPLKGYREEYVLHCILYHLEGHPHVRGDALHKGPLLMERLLQAWVCGLRVPTFHPIQGGY